MCIIEDTSIILKLNTPYSVPDTRLILPDGTADAMRVPCSAIGVGLRKGIIEAPHSLGS